MKKNIIIGIISLLLLFLAGLYFFSDKFSKPSVAAENIVLVDTYDLAKEYLNLRYRSDDLLVNAADYADYTAWQSDLAVLIADWQRYENAVNALETLSTQEAAATALNFELLGTARAYTAKEITNIYDRAPKFKGIATLAKHLGVDANKAQLILNQAQDETTAEGWTEAGDTLQKLETSAVVIKDGCKVAGFVGGVVITGGMAGMATAGTLTTTTTVVVGVDLALEVTEDGAQIAFGDKNKVSSFVKDIRTVTEPVANLLTITNIPSNLGTAFGKFDSVMIGLEQLRDSAQEGKVVGVDLTNFEYQPPFQVIHRTKYPGEVSAAVIEEAELEEWLASLNKKTEPMSQEEVLDFLSSSTSTGAPEVAATKKVEPSEKAAEEPSAEPGEEAVETVLVGNAIVGSYSGSAILQHVAKDVEAEANLPVTLELYQNGTGTVNVDGFTGEAEHAGNSVSFLVSMKEDGATIWGSFKGRVTSSGEQTVISGDLKFSMMGINFATYSWTAAK